MRRQSFIWTVRRRTALATQPGRFRGPHHPFPIRSCSVWGLPSRPVTRTLVRSYRTFPPLPASKIDVGGFRFYGTFPEVTLAGRYPAHCPVEPGLSSDASGTPAIAFHTRKAIIPAPAPAVKQRPSKKDGPGVRQRKSSPPGNPQTDCFFYVQSQNPKDTLTPPMTPFFFPA